VADRNIVCPVHRWTYNPDGLLIGAPHFRQSLPQSAAEKLERWQGLLFKGPRSANADLAGMQVAGELDFSGYKLDKVEIHECNYNWKTFIEVYLEDYHVVPFHPGLGSSSPATT
jgi:phenylpropionate dioxygenase-like ring-hydroxylating dioxygenase large terminal subunit